MTEPSLRPAPTVVRSVVDGRTVAVTVPDAEDCRAVRAILSGFPVPRGDAAPDATYAVRRDTRGGWEVASGDVRTHQTTTLEDALLGLEWQLVTDMLGRIDNRFHLHGAALADPSGTISLLVPGESGIGKTTLTLALMARGFRPFTDDVVLIDPDALTPHTFERAFHVDATTRTLVEALPHGPDWETPGMPAGYFMPSAWARAPLAVGAVIVPKARDHARPLLVSMPIAEAATTLLAFSGSLEHVPALALKAAARITATAPCYALYGGELARTAQFLAEAIEELCQKKRKEKREK